MFTTPKPYPAEFRWDVVAVARQGCTVAPLAKDLGTTESCCRNALRRADNEDGKSPAVTAAEATEMRGLRVFRVEQLAGFPRFRSSGKVWSARLNWTSTGSGNRFVGSDVGVGAPVCVDLLHEFGAVVDLLTVQSYVLPYVLHRSEAAFT